MKDDYGADTFGSEEYQSYNKENIDGILEGAGFSEDDMNNAQNGGMFSGQMFDQWKYNRTMDEKADEIAASQAQTYRNEVENEGNIMFNSMPKYETPAYGKRGLKFKTRYSR